MKRTLLVALALAVVALALGVYAVGIHTPSGPRSIREFDPDRVADLEVGMWKAYYDKRKLELFRLLVVMLHEQYRYTWAKATVAGYHLAKSAEAFGDMRSDYDRVLPGLERAYGIARDWTHAGYDPKTVARAELAWWVARRKPAENSAENVGRLIAEEYALLYEVPIEKVASAALLRARAAKLRDERGKDADWATVEELLRTSYRDLRASVNR